jgi:hypothetical protein
VPRLALNIHADTNPAPPMYALFVEKVEIANINVPGRTARVDAEKYEAMKSAILKVTPNEAPGIGDGGKGETTSAEAPLAKGREGRLVAEDGSVGPRGQRPVEAPSQIETDEVVPHVALYALQVSDHAAGDTHAPAYHHGTYRF